MTDRAEGQADAIRGSLDGVHDTTHEMDRGVLPTGELPALIRTPSASKPRIRPIRFTIKALLFIIIAVFLLAAIGGRRRARRGRRR